MAVRKSRLRTSLDAMMTLGGTLASIVAISAIFYNSRSVAHSCTKSAPTPGFLEPRVKVQARHRGVCRDAKSGQRRPSLLDKQTKGMFTPLRDVVGDDIEPSCKEQRGPARADRPGADDGDAFDSRDLAHGLTSVLAAAIVDQDGHDKRRLVAG